MGYRRYRLDADRIECVLRNTWLRAYRQHATQGSRSGKIECYKIKRGSRRAMVALTKGTSAQWAAQTGRACGQCSLCCKLLHVKELDKPANRWCQHCRPGKGGCSIWGATPEICKSYFCGWRI